MNSQASDVFIYRPDTTPVGVTLTGDNGIANYLKGSTRNDTITGGDQADLLNGERGNDRISGGGGQDTMTGGAGADVFVLGNTAASADVIRDFEPGKDLLEIASFTFGGGLTPCVQPTVVNAADLASGTLAQANGYFVFDTTGADAGTLYWDATGGATTDAVKIAELTNLTLLQGGNFQIV